MLWTPYTKYSAIVFVYVWFCVCEVSFKMYSELDFVHHLQWSSSRVWMNSMKYTVCVSEYFFICVFLCVFVCENLTFLNFHRRVLHLCQKDWNWRIAQFRNVWWPDIVRDFDFWCYSIYYIKYGEIRSLIIPLSLRVSLDWKAHFKGSFQRGKCSYLMKWFF